MITKKVADYAQECIKLDHGVGSDGVHQVHPMVVAMANAIIEMKPRDNTLIGVERLLKEAGFHSHAHDALVGILSHYKELGSLKFKLEDMARDLLSIPRSHFTADNLRRRIERLLDEILKRDDTIAEYKRLFELAKKWKHQGRRGRKSWSTKESLDLWDYVDLLEKKSEP